MFPPQHPSIPEVITKAIIANAITWRKAALRLIQVAPGLDKKRDSVDFFEVTLRGEHNEKDCITCNYCRDCGFEGIENLVALCINYLYCGNSGTDIACNGYASEGCVEFTSFQNAKGGEFNTHSQFRMTQYGAFRERYDSTFTTFERLCAMEAYVMANEIYIVATAKDQSYERTRACVRGRTCFEWKTVYSTSRFRELEDFKATLEEYMNACGYMSRSNIENIY